MKKFILVLLLICSLLCLNGCTKTCEKCEGVGTINCSDCSTGKVKCSSCKNGKTICATCSGKIRFECDECNGDKRIRSSQRCQKCADSKKKGYTYDDVQALKDLLNGVAKDADDYWEKCTSCNGSGYGIITCPDCKGSGYGPDCAACNGTGFGPDCNICSGSGTVTCTNCDGSQLEVCPNCNGVGEI